MNSKSTYVLTRGPEVYNYSIHLIPEGKQETVTFKFSITYLLHPQIFLFMQNTVLHPVLRLMPAM